VRGRDVVQGSYRPLATCAQLLSFLCGGRRHWGRHWRDVRPRAL